MDFLPEGVAFNKDITYLAKTNFRAKEQVFGIRRKDRRQHMYILGKSGTGKSAFLGNMIVQNIWNGEGVCVIDPHGELVESILATIPAHRVKDVVYFNPADTDYHIGFNVLEVEDPRYSHLVASGLMGIFTKIWANVWSSRMEYIMNNAILALVEMPGSTMLGIPRLLVDKDYRQVVINNVKDPVIKSFWIHEFESWREQFRNEAIAPIQNKVGQFLSTSIVRNVVGQSKSTIDLFNIMNTGKIFLVNVSKGRIGEDNSALLGGMLITKLQLAAMERVRIPEDERRDFYLYVDEFQNFVTESFASILSEARKYRLNLTLAHQYIAQLSTKDSDSVRDAVFGNVGTMIIFRVGAADGDFLEKEFEPEFEIQDMVNLPNYSCYMKLMVDGVTSRPFSALTLPPFKTPAASTVTEEIIESSRKLYARPRTEVEAEINKWSGMGGEAAVAEGKFKAECSSCQKDTSVPFAPEPGRPVYCKDCITKIKSGEMKPLKGTRGKDLRPQSYAPLAGLGIEFTSDAATPAPRPRPAGPSTSPARVPAFTKPFQKAIPSALHATTPQAPVARPAPLPRKEADHAGLQNILKQALGTAIAAEEKKIPAPVVTPVKVEEKKTISLHTLKKHDEQTVQSHAADPVKSGVPKVASSEHLTALQAAIAQARKSVVETPKAEASAEPKKMDPVASPVEASAPAPKIEMPLPPQKEEPTIEVKEEKVEEPKKEAVKSQQPPESTKVIREVPEDILKSVLAD